MHLALYMMQSPPDPEQIQRIAMTVMAILPFILLIALAIAILPLWFICKKAGFSPWLSFLTVIPFGGLVLMYVLAFGEWKVVPVQRQGWPPMPPPPHM